MLTDTLARNTLLYADKVALDFIQPPLQRISYAELGDLIERTAAYLRDLGVAPGDRVALQLPKCLEFILLNLATLRLGAISLPLNPAYTADEIEFFLRDSAARLFFAAQPAGTSLMETLPLLPALQHAVMLTPGRPEDFLARLPSTAALPPAHACQPNDTAVIVYTSGTTGRPKGAEITHGNLMANLTSLHTAWEWRAEDVVLHVLPLFHIHGLFVALYGALYAGATTLLMREYEASATLQALIERGCTVFMAVPTIHRRLLAAAGSSRIDLSHVRLITSGSDRLPDEVYAGYQRTFACTLVERYGLTETGINCSNPVRGERRMGSVGPPLPGVEARVADARTALAVPDGEVGEIQVRGANVFRGYWGQPDQTAAAFTTDGWFRTGDLGFRHADGYITLCGRSKDLILSGGFNVYPPEVERVLGEHPAVEASAVIGCPDAEWGERVAAVVVLKETPVVSSDDLMAYCRQKLAPYKCPKSIFFSTGLPRNAMGKVQKAELRALFCSRSA